MKLIIYTLNPDGTIPDYVIDGGYFAASNKNESPQDFDLVGIATNEANQIGFVDKESLINYVAEKNFASINVLTDKPINMQTIIDYLWSKYVSS